MVVSARMGLQESTKQRSMAPLGMAGGLVSRPPGLIACSQPARGFLTMLAKRARPPTALTITLPAMLPTSLTGSQPHLTESLLRSMKANQSGMPKLMPSTNSTSSRFQDQLVPLQIRNSTLPMTMKRTEKSLMAAPPTPQVARPPHPSAVAWPLSPTGAKGTLKIAMATKKCLT